VAFVFPAEDRCVVCASWEGEAASTVVAANRHAVCLVPEAVRAAGAVVVVPRRHALTAMDLDGPEMADVAALVHRVTRAIESSFDPDGLNIWWATGRLAGQPVEHLMVELCPRFAAIPYKYLEWDEIPRWPLADRRQMAERIKACLDDRE
jgi:histidine triad (HIT) family protein